MGGGSRVPDDGANAGDVREGPGLQIHVPAEVARGLGRRAEWGESECPPPRHPRHLKADPNRAVSFCRAVAD